MNWFWFAVIALLCWSGSDFFSKIGCRDGSDKDSHLKMVVAVGVIMGLHAAYEVFLNDVPITWDIIWLYLPVSLLYIVSMALGYVGLRYIELSISSPICNSSGALVAILSIITGTAGEMVGMQYLAVAMACIGVVALSLVEANEDDDLRKARQQASNYKYAKSWMALALPIAYCLLDAAGTFADALVLDKLGEGMADSCNVAYELTFLFAGAVSLVYLLVVKKAKFKAELELPKYLGAICETVGQLFYIYALSDTEHVAMAAPIISSYCAVSVLWSRLFLKGKLSWKHYLSIAVIVAGIIIMGVFDM